MKQLSLLEDAILSTYDAGVTDNATMYERVSSALGLTNEIKPIGEDLVPRSVLHRKLRWAQQNLKAKGHIKRVSRGQWELTSHKKIELHSISAAKHMVAMSTSLGVAIWSKSNNIFGSSQFNEPIHLALTSPPYPLKQARAYGNVTDIMKYIDFICEALEPIVKNLYTGGNIALNIGNDIFETGSPARSTYVERLVIALVDRFGLSLMDRMPWHCPNKIPTPIAWASKKRTQLNSGYEHILWFCNDPNKCISSNNRVLKPHSPSHQRFIDSGGHKTASVNGDGAYVKKLGAWSNQTAGTIPKNVLTYHNTCTRGRTVSSYAKELGIPAHAAKMPYDLADFLVRFLSREDDLIVDPFGGTFTSGEAAERNSRRWICTDMIWEYARQSFIRFSDTDTFVNPAFVNARFAA
ncbi:MAG: site-specific DNA-methyltransferase [Colwellia sp.]|nr:site-specific DNA-methyltransferase [Colwellia sp.]